MEFNLITMRSRIKPEILKNIYGNTWIYSFDITEKIDEIEVVDTEGNINIEKATIYYYTPIQITGTPTVENCYNKIVALCRDENENNVVESPETIDYLQKLKNKIASDLGENSKSELDLAKEIKVNQITDFDISKEVNSFFLNGNQVWLDKNTRVGLMNSLSIERASGKDSSVLWFGNLKLHINTEAAIQMLSALELYALECYNKTAEHKVNIQNMTSVEGVTNYDYTKGYPEKLNFSI